MASPTVQCDGAVTVTANVDLTSGWSKQGMTFCAMSIAVTGRLVEGGSPVVEAALVKDLGTEFEQAVPDLRLPQDGRHVPLERLDDRGEAPGRPRVRLGSGFLVRSRLPVCGERVRVRGLRPT